MNRDNYPSRKGKPTLEQYAIQKLMNISVVLGILRHVLTTVGGALVTNGTITSDGLEQGVGAAITLIGLGWSIYNKKK